MTWFSRATGLANMASDRRFDGAGEHSGAGTDTKVRQVYISKRIDDCPARGPWIGPDFAPV